MSPTIAVARVSDTLPPLSLSSQGKTLDVVDVHCGKQFAPGHLYVALSRVKRLSRLRVVGFDRKHLIPPSKEVLNFLDNLSNVPADEQCNRCRVKIPSPNDTLDSDITSTEELSEGELEEIDEVVRLYFASSSSSPISTTSYSSSSDTVNLAKVMENLSSLESFKSIPADFSYDKFIKSLKKTEHFSGQSNDLQSGVNGTFDFLLRDDVLSRTKLFLGIQWDKLFSLIRTRISENVSEVLKRTEFTCHFGNLHAFVTLKEIEREFAEVLGIHVSSFVKHHFHALTEMMMSLNTNILQTIVDDRFPSSTTKGTPMNVREMENETKGKTRYCGAWAIAKGMKSCQNYFRSNIYSSDQNVCGRAKQEYRKNELLSQSTLSSYKVELESKAQESLNITFSREYAKGTLVHISDDVFEWFLDLEQQRVNLLTRDSVAIHHDDLVEHVLSNINKNERLKEKWHALFVGHCLVPEIVPSQEEVDSLVL